MPLKRLLIIVFIVISAIPLYIGLKTISKSAYEHSRSQYIHHLESMADNAEQGLNVAIDRIRDNTALITSRTQLRLSLKTLNEDNRTQNTARITKIINDAYLSLEMARFIRVFDTKGHIVSTTRINDEIQSIRPETWPNKPLVILSENDSLIFATRQPLTIDHEIVGYIEIGFQSTFIQKQIKEWSGLGKTGEWLFAMRDKNGDALFVTALKYDHQAAFKRVISKESLDIPITQALLGNEMIMNKAPDYRGVDVIAATRYIPDLDLGLVAKIDESEVHAILKENDIFIFLIEISIIVISVVFGIVLAFLIAKPIERLRDHTSTIREGNLTEPENVNASWQEARDLTEHFGYMIRTLKSLNENLQQKVDKQTKELLEKNKELEILATHDPLTGLCNRRHFDLKLSEEFERHKRYQTALAVVMMDIDHFKSINDRYGHATGDQVLKQVAEMLQATIRETDLAARIGGEEFCLILPESSAASASSFIERLRKQISNIKLMANNEVFSVTMSFGIADCHGEVDFKETLLKHADLALYQAKNSGRNKVVQYSRNLDAVTQLKPN